jgi:hypothetical protein
LFKHSLHLFVVRRLRRLPDADQLPQGLSPLLGNRHRSLFLL